VDVQKEAYCKDLPHTVLKLRSHRQETDWRIVAELQSKAQGPGQPLVGLLPKTLEEMVF
jgi:hypothetical protein